MQRQSFELNFCIKKHQDAQLTRSDIFEILVTRDCSSMIWQKYSDS